MLAFCILVAVVVAVIVWALHGKTTRTNFQGANMNFQDVIEFAVEVACATAVVVLLGGMLFSLIEVVRYVVA